MSLSELCLDCGLCCDGTLFSHVKVTAAEREALVGLGIGTGHKRGHAVMWLPCGKLEGKCCTVYAARPGGCRAFVCALGAKLTRKEVSLDDAKAQVREMLARLAALREVLGGGDALVLRRAREAMDGAAPLRDGVAEAFGRVEELRYSVFMPPPS
jgi:hypothetical protein